MSIISKFESFLNSGKVLRIVNYPLRLGINAARILLNYGFMAVFAKTKLFIKKVLKPESIYNENKVFQKWLVDYEAEKARKYKNGTNFEKNPKLSIIIPVYNPPRKYFEKAIESIKKQYYKNWEICLSDDASTEEWIKPYLQQLADDDKRIKITFAKENGHIAVNSNRAAELATSDHIILMDNDDELPPYALAEYAKALGKYPDADIIYGDEFKLDMEDNPIEPWFRHSYSRELDFSMAAITHCVVSKKAFETVGGFRKGYEGAQDYDLFLRISENTEEIYHIPEMLYKWRKIPGSTAAHIDQKSYAITAARRAIKDAADRRGIEGTVHGSSFPFRFSPKIQGDPKVEIIIPTKDHYKYLSKAIKSMQRFTKYENYTITIVDHESTEKRTIRLLESLKDNPRFKIQSFTGKYSFSKMNNQAVAKSDADYIVFANNDLQIVSKNWIEELIRWAQLPEVGPVGTLLIYPDGRVQHAGVLLGVGGVANHAYWMDLESTMDYFNNIRLVRNYSAVTAALMAVSREKFNAVGGFEDKDFSVAYQDLDFCLKMWEKGYRTVYTPYAKAIHHESVSRDESEEGRRPETSQDRLFIKKWPEWTKNDPFYNPHFERGNKGEAQRTHRIEKYKKYQLDK